MQTVLAGIRVIDFSHSWAGPHSSRILADFGAEVIKVEYVRRLCLLRGGRRDAQHYDTHVGWHQVNRNKLSVTLDLRQQAERDLFRELLRQADVLIESSRPQVMARLGFSYDEVRKLKDDIIMLSMSAFGQTGPYASFAGYGAVMEGLSGIQSLTGYTGEERPLRIKELDVINGTAGAYAVVNALYHRSNTGKGQHIDLSQFETATHSLIGEQLLEFDINGSCSPPTGNRHRYVVPSGCYACRGEDEWITISIRNQGEWERLCKVLEKEQWKTDRRFGSRQTRKNNHELIDREIEGWSKQFSASTAMEILQKQGVPAAAVVDMQGLVQCTHLEKRNYFIPTEEAGKSGERAMGFAMKFSRSSGRVKWFGPRLGEHNQRIAEKLARTQGSPVPSFNKEEIRTAFDED